MRTSERLTNGSNRSLRSLGRAKARPLTKRYAFYSQETQMIVIVWRGYGWLVPIILFACLLGMEVSVETFTANDQFYQTHEWPKYTALIAGAVLVGIFGYYVNWVNRPGIYCSESKQFKKAPSHSLFAIPIEYWSLIVLVPLAASYWLS